ncbi:GNAT family N-acetyltransferase [Paenibacillus lignilyticus]|uniref:GNAT family N-acetyltransferase n=1 Tax=Paenibacillus lignilyticus TaxID=1172615 RepID=A0ABS5CGU1_9BACL|nr:GNAT family N-acetyltransferase [Paenibacillus lignilyticus]MBP3965098.1 GNAT family N-acetyltransferase [Paenibacillus lignilyticus]
MSKLRIRSIGEDEELPYRLLLLADPERQAIDAYAGRSTCAVLEEDRQVIGVYLLLATRPKTAEIMNIAVREDCQGRGLGRKLIEHAVQCCKELGYRAVEIGTGNSSLNQLGLYQKCGFRVVGVETDYFVKHYAEPIVENGIPCRDMIRLRMEW